jgi:hypothetical protein
LISYQTKESVAYPQAIASQTSFIQQIVAIDLYEASHHVFLSLGNILHFSKSIKIIWEIFEYLKIYTLKHKDGNIIFGYFEKIMYSTRLNDLDDLVTGYLVITAFRILSELGPLVKVN